MLFDPKTRALYKKRSFRKGKRRACVVVRGRERERKWRRCDCRRSVKVRARFLIKMAEKLRERYIKRNIRSKKKGSRSRSRIQTATICSMTFTHYVWRKFRALLFLFLILFFFSFKRLLLTLFFKSVFHCFYFLFLRKHFLSSYYLEDMTLIEI